jgi:hypothetical protein
MLRVVRESLRAAAGCSARPGLAERLLQHVGMGSLLAPEDQTDGRVRAQEVNVRRTSWPRASHSGAPTSVTGTSTPQRPKAAFVVLGGVSRRVEVVSLLRSHAQTATDLAERGPPGSNPKRSFGSSAAYLERVVEPVEDLSVRHRAVEDLAVHTRAVGVDEMHEVFAARERIEEFLGIR